MERPVRDCKSRHNLIYRFMRQGGAWQPMIAGYYLAETEPHTMKGAGRYGKYYNICINGHTQKRSQSSIRLSWPRGNRQIRRQKQCPGHQKNGKQDQKAVAC